MISSVASPLSKWELFQSSLLRAYREATNLGCASSARVAISSAPGRRTLATKRRTCHMVLRPSRKAPGLLGPLSHYLNKLLIERGKQARPPCWKPPSPDLRRGPPGACMTPSSVTNGSHHQLSHVLSPDCAGFLKRLTPAFTPRGPSAQREDLRAWNALVRPHLRCHVSSTHRFRTTCFAVAEHAPHRSSCVIERRAVSKRPTQNATRLADMTSIEECST